MKDFFTYFSGVIYSVKQCMLTWKKPKIYPIMVFIISCIMLLAPVQFTFINTSVNTIVNQIPNIEVVLKDVSKDLNSKNIEVKIENNKVVSSDDYQTYINGFMVYIGIELEDYPEVDENNVKETDNLIIFGEKEFYARHTKRDNNEKFISNSVLSGNYSKANSFDFKKIFESKTESAAYVLVGTFLKAIYLSNSSYNLLSWTFIIEIYNLIFILIGGFILLYANKKGNRDYKITYGQSFLTIMASIALPALITTIVGMFNFTFFTIVYVVLSFTRLIRLCHSQISRNTAYNQLEEETNDYELKFK